MIERRWIVRAENGDYVCVVRRCVDGSVELDTMKSDEQPKLLTSDEAKQIGAALMEAAQVAG